MQLQSDANFPVREDLHESYPDILPMGFDFVRRWDGFVTFQWDAVTKTWKLHAGLSGNIKISADSASTIADKILRLDVLELKLQLLNRIHSEAVSASQLSAGDLEINNQVIIPLTSVSDTLSTINNAASAISKAAAINTAFDAVTDENRVWATVNSAVVEGVPVTVFTGLGSGGLIINGVSIDTVATTVEQVAQADAIKNAINKAFPGEEIVVSKTVDNALILTAADGRNIDIALIGAETEQQCGFSAGTYYSSITLAARSAININGNNPEHAGLVVGITPVVQFVAGDYWLADVREAEHRAGSVLIKNKPPQGIEHHYITLGKVNNAGKLQPNPEADRKYAFPALTEMTRMFKAGGDGQEVVSGAPLPQPLRVAVSNGEWPVKGATVRFRIEEGGGALSAPVTGVVTDSEGIAESDWSPGSVIGAKCRVKVTLVNPEDPAQDLGHPPVYFYA
ncbi:MAG: hypothetical protein KAJ63_09195, partial [Methyloprofundus sp.]|nr:hypothetical protein [Methyloprofundus sp.]